MNLCGVARLIKHPVKKIEQYVTVPKFDRTTECQL